MSNYLAAYVETMFAGEPFPNGFPSHFAIITACPPSSRQWSDARRQVADQRLRLRTRRWKPHRITSRSHAGRHNNPGWAVSCSKRTAMLIAREFGQDVYFWVDEGELQIIAVAQSRPIEAAGSFAQKFLISIGADAELLWRSVIVGETECSRFICDSGLKFSRTDFLLIGEGGDSPYHSWKLGYWLLTAPECGVRALEEAEFSCGNDGDPDDEGDGPPTLGSRIVALLADSSANDIQAAKQLFNSWSESPNARQIDGFCEVSKLGESAVNCC